MKLELEVVQDQVVGDPAAVVPTTAPHTAPPPPPRPHPFPRLLLSPAPPLALPIVGVCPPFARTDCVFEVCGVGALQGVGFSFRGGRGAGRGGARRCLWYGGRRDL